MKPRPRGPVARGWDGVEGTPHDRALVTRVRGQGLHQENHKVRREIESRAAPKCTCLLPKTAGLFSLSIVMGGGAWGGADIMGTIPRVALYQPL